MPHIAITTCTFNPDPEIFKKVLNSFSCLNFPDTIDVEGVIVDNNSQPPLNSFPYVQEFLQKCNWFKLIVEPIQGKTNAVVRAVLDTTAEIIINFDDDNLPNEEYLLEVTRLIEKYPEVAIWGPGNIKVSFTGEVETWVEKYALGFFQEKATQEIKIDRNIHADCNPLGTGMVMRRSVLNIYVDNFRKGLYTNLCRTGNNLSTGGDLQIVLTAIKEGWYCGSSPFLKIEHLIPVKRSKMHYVLKLVFGYGSSINDAIVEVFPEEISKIHIPKMNSLLPVIVKKWIQTSGKYYSIVQFKIELADMIGKVSGAYKIHKKEEPFWVLLLINFFKLR